VEKRKKTKKAVEDKYEEIKRDLEKQKSTLLAEAGETITGALGPTTANFPDMTDQASAETDQYFLLRLKEREQKLLKKIDDALERIANGTFGICESCGKEIGYKRLKARPVTTLCIDCKTQQEAEEKIRES
jgi:DnaK suppressor protein